MSAILRPGFPAAPVPVDAAHSGPAVSSVSAGPAGGAVARHHGAAPPVTRPTMPDNPIAQCIGLAVRQMLALPVPLIRGIGDADDLLGRRDLLVQFAKIVDPIIAEIMSECAEHANNIDRSYYTSILSDAFEDRCVLGALELAAADLGADEDEIASDPRGWAKAAELGVD